MQSSLWFPIRFTSWRVPGFIILSKSKRSPLGPHQKLKAPPCVAGLGFAHGLGFADYRSYSSTSARGIRPALSLAYNGEQVGVRRSALTRLRPN